MRQFGSLRCAHRTRSYDRSSLLPLVEVLPLTDIVVAAHTLAHTLQLSAPGPGRRPHEQERVPLGHVLLRGHVRHPGHPVHVSRRH